MPGDGFYDWAGRRVNFGTMASAPRLWTDLWLCEDAHREWVLEHHNTRDLKEAGARVWFACQRTCDG